MSLLPDDDDEPMSLLPPEERNAPDPDLFVGRNDDEAYDELKKRAIPKYKNLMPKKVIARPTGVAALVFDIFFGVLVYFNIKTYLDSITSFNWSQILNYILGTFNQLVTTLKNSSRNMIGFAALGLLALLVTYVWAYSDQKVSSCPVCKKKNYGNFNTCAKCNYIFYPREIIDHEILSIKFNNLDFLPAQISADLKERHLADLSPKHIKHVLVKNHFF
ncbi:MAG TPA: hypothetical protein VKM55_16745 [Candidatus Lokiarchaeia archaeon]|nr:hypothetical protein [Candidatus Lokiarchaeia archaeon]